MAALIAQITRANRERINKKRFEIIISKCMYEIKPFPDKYEPEVSQMKYFNVLALAIFYLDFVCI